MVALKKAKKKKTWREAL